MNLILSTALRGGWGRQGFRAGVDRPEAAMRALACGCHLKIELTVNRLCRQYGHLVDQAVASPMGVPTASHGESPVSQTRLNPPLSSLKEAHLV